VGVPPLPTRGTDDVGSARHRARAGELHRVALVQAPPRALHLLSSGGSGGGARHHLRAGLLGAAAFALAAAAVPLGVVGVEEAVVALADAGSLAEVVSRNEAGETITLHPTLVDDEKITGAPSLKVAGLFGLDGLIRNLKKMISKISSPNPVRSPRSV